MKKLAVTALLVTSGLCGCKHETVAVHQHTPKQYVVVVDLSVSREQEVLNEDQQFVARLASQLDFGDQIVLLQMQQANLSDSPLRMAFEMPTTRKGKASPRDRQDLSGEQQTVEDSVPEIFKSKDNAKVQHTDIFATMDVVGEKVHDRGDAQSSEIILLSDMLQSAEGYEMEHLAHMPKNGWIAESARSGKLPHLPGACVAVIGEDTSSRDAPQIREFWQRYFAAAGAHLADEDVRRTAPDSVQSLCRAS